MEKLINNKKNIIIGILVLGVIFIPIILSSFNRKDIINVDVETIDSENIPNQIIEILPNYRMKEKALISKINDEIYVIVTRGEKSTAGYEVEIDKLTITEENGEKVLTVYANYTDPKPGDDTAQILTYPFTVVKTDIEELPQKIILEKEYIIKEEKTDVVEKDEDKLDSDVNTNINNDPNESDLNDNEVVEEEPMKDLKDNKFLKELPENAIAQITLRNMNGLGTIKLGHNDRNNIYVFDVLYTFDENLVVSAPGLDRETSFWNTSDYGIDPISLMNYGRATFYDEINGHYDYYGLVNREGKVLIQRLYQGLTFKRNNKFGTALVENYNNEFLKPHPDLSTGGYIIDENGNIIKENKLEVVYDIHGKVIEIDGEIITFGDVNQEIKTKLEQGYKLIDYNRYFLDYYLCFSENDPLAYVVDIDLNVIETINKEDYFANNKSPYTSIIDKHTYINGEEYWDIEINDNYGEETNLIYGHKVFRKSDGGDIVITDENNNIVFYPEIRITRIYHVVNGQRFYKIRGESSNDKGKTEDDYILDLKELKVLTCDEFANKLLTKVGLIMEGTDALAEDYKIIKEGHLSIEDNMVPLYN